MSREPDDFSRGDSVDDRQASHTGAQVEASWTRGAGIHDQPVVRSLDESAVRVAKHQDVGRVRAQHFFWSGSPELVSVAHVNCQSTHSQLDAGLELRVRWIVDISEHGPDRRDVAQRTEHARAADVTGVQNERDARQCRRYVVSKLSVRIGHETDEVLRSH